MATARASGLGRAARVPVPEPALHPDRGTGPRQLHRRRRHPVSGLRGELFHDKHRASIRKAQEAMVEGLKTAAEAH